MNYVAFLFCSDISGPLYLFDYIFLNFSCITIVTIILLKSFSTDM